MSRKSQHHTLNRIRRHHDAADEWDGMEELTQHERIRKQPREERSSSGIKQQRRQHDKAWGRTINRVLRKRREDEQHKP